MAGKAGRSGRRARPLSLAEHRLRGTYRPDRHGALAAVPACADGWQPSASDLAGLSGAGRAFVQRIADGWLLTDAQGPLLTVAARTLDEITAYDQAISAAGFVVTAESTGKPRAHPLARARAGAVKLFASLVRQLELKP